ncbi:hypothetical protein TNCV_1193511 [Trichonephila clavipes]|nr:hypothetical protein TNCV_1193511 [Trichonephila clavipes]
MFHSELHSEWNCRPSGIMVSEADCCAVGPGRKFSSEVGERGRERWEASEHLQDVLPLNWGGTKPNHIVTCMYGAQSYG